MLLHLWLGGLSALLFGLAGFSLWAALKARTHRMSVDRRLDDLGHDVFNHADGLARRCDALGAAIERLTSHLNNVDDRARLLELERELARLAASGRLDAAASARLEDAVAALRAAIADKEP